MSLYLGVDAGGTRSTALVVDGSGVLRGRADGRAANYQNIGAAAAREVLRQLVAEALTAAQATPRDLSHACYGIAGADRPKDFAAIEHQLPAVPAAVPRSLVNDTMLVLRAGTPDGVGMALVSGTGTNALGRDARGKVARVGGFCPELGDFGSAPDLGREALRLAMRGHDGRGRPTRLYEDLCATLGVDPLEDVIDAWMSGDPRANDFGSFAPLVFAAAAQGDVVARDLLTRAGSELALCVRVLAQELFAGGEPFTVVLGGSVLQRGADPTVLHTLAAELAQTHPRARVVRLAVEPAVGAVLLASDLDRSRSAGQQAELAAGLAAAFGPSFAEPVAVDP